MSKNTKRVEFNAKRYERNGLTADEVLEIKEAFDLFDTDGSGHISTDELKQALRNLGIDARNQTLSNMMNDLDKNSDNTIDFDEFIDMMTAKMSDTDNREDLLKVFNLFLGEDAGTRNDKIRIQHLRRVAKELNEAMGEDELNEMIARADLDKDQGVSFDEFYAIMTKKI